MKQEIREIIEKYGVEEIEASLNEIIYFGYLEKGFNNFKKKFNLTDKQSLEIIENFLNRKKENSFISENEIKLEEIFKNLNNTNLEIIQFIKNNLLGLKIVRLTEYPEYDMYFDNEGSNIFQHDLKTNNLGVNYELIWKVFKIKFGYNYDKIKELIKSVIEQIYKIKEIEPYRLDYDENLEVEEAYQFLIKN